MAIPSPTTFDVTVATLAGFPTSWGYSDGLSTVNPNAATGGSVSPSVIPNGNDVHELYTYGLGPLFVFTCTGDVGEDYIASIEQVGFETFTVGAGAGYGYSYDAGDDMTTWVWSASGFHWNAEAGNNNDAIVTWGTDADVPAPPPTGACYDIQMSHRRSTAAQWTADDPVLLEGERGLETDTKFQKIGDGVTAWTALPYWHGPPWIGGIGGAGPASTFPGAPVTLYGLMGTADA